MFAGLLWIKPLANISRGMVSFRKDLHFISESVSGPLYSSVLVSDLELLFRWPMSIIVKWHLGD